MLCTVNAMVNLNNYTSMILICVETNWPGSWFEMVVLGCRSFMLVIISIVLLTLFSECICTYSSYFKNPVPLRSDKCFQALARALPSIPVSIMPYH